MQVMAPEQGAMACIFILPGMHYEKCNPAKIVLAFLSYYVRI
jgi:hypothetical protein